MRSCAAPSCIFDYQRAAQGSSRVAKMKVRPNPIVLTRAPTEPARSIGKKNCG
jgi:hypothetical protein